MKHQCRICEKSFASGQALGGHMRSHPASKSPSQIEISPHKRIIKPKSLENEYYLLEHRKKEIVVKHKSLENEDCLVGHCNKEIVVKPKSLENEDCLVEHCKKEIVVKRKSLENEDYLAGDCKKEIVEAAGCLMLLSRDPLFWAATEKSYFGLDFGNFKRLKVRPLNKNFENVDRFGGKQFNFVTEISDDEQLNGVNMIKDEKVKKPTKVKSFKKGKSKVPSLNESGQYKCATCQRTFNSFQALGGHVASHRKSIASFQKNSEIGHMVFNTSEEDIGFLDLNLRI
ncbi:hypothetical protein LUZ60_000873 [Juncus effusus]|nr:hypothetical protein LUZ60_000873 [Juncus effusus]